MRYLPYVIGLFMLSPLFIWSGLWIAFPGPKPGITDAPFIASLIGISIPLAFYHYIAGLAFIANSIEGGAGEIRPRWAPARWLQKAMIPLTAFSSLAAITWLFRLDVTPLYIGFLALSGALLTFGLIKAEGGQGPFNIHHTLASVVTGSVSAFQKVLMNLPLIGVLLREISRNPHRAAPYLVANVALGTILFVWLFGFVALVIPAMLAVPVAFYLMMTLAAN
jgi:hypothetical protein